MRDDRRVRLEPGGGPANAGAQPGREPRWGEVGEVVPIAHLNPADSPRVLGEDGKHVRDLAASDAQFPPVVVHRGTMRVIDGMHRLRAAEMRGSASVRVVFFDGDDENAFVLAVRANTAQGLPLSQADRTAAATRILGSHPHWSDRRIASIVGLAATTVGAIRCSTERNGQSNARVGRDGRIRPLNTRQGRILAGKLIVSNPKASMREIANAAKISVSTAHDVAKRIRAGDDPVPLKWREADDGIPDHSDRAPLDPVPDESAGVRRAQLLDALRKDPSLRFSESGRNLIRWLTAQVADEAKRRSLLDAVPRHCAGTLAELARENSRIWAEFAGLLEELDQVVGG
ncbi:ParB/RepB/Spo0J family partition protein [Saccharopolyspora sp. NPDC050642]|uniref:ParB/RepB/Spo0J family partition protein n=1 Tax=Saccharopolyspora sp. NPDC050642 TaxID=3157099 RepID=UPI00340CD83C